MAVCTADVTLCMCVCGGGRGFGGTSSSAHFSNSYTNPTIMI